MLGDKNSGLDYLFSLREPNNSAWLSPFWETSTPGPQPSSFRSFGSLLGKGSSQITVALTTFSAYPPLWNNTFLISNSDNTCVTPSRYKERLSSLYDWADYGRLLSRCSTAPQHTSGRQIDIYNCVFTSTAPFKPLQPKFTSVGPLRVLVPNKDTKQSKFCRRTLEEPWINCARV
jgi:hypothetical protein